jgi:hypothetical protein
MLEFGMENEMIMSREEGNPHLKAAILEAVENQMRDNDPPETNQTYDRLVHEGHSEEDAKRLIGCVIVSEIFDILKKEQDFNLARFIKALQTLPELPED